MTMRTLMLAGIVLTGATPLLAHEGHDHNAPAASPPGVPGPVVVPPPAYAPPTYSPPAYTPPVYAPPAYTPPAHHPEARPPIVVPPPVVQQPVYPGYGSGHGATCPPVVRRPTPGEVWQRMQVYDPHRVKRAPRFEW